MQLNRLLEGQSLFHNVSVLDRYHAVVDVGGVLHLLRRLLVFESRVARPEWVHLVALAHLETQSAHLVLQQLIVQVGAWTRVLPDLF